MSEETGSEEKGSEEKGSEEKGSGKRRVALKAPHLACSFGRDWRDWKPSPVGEAPNHLIGTLTH